MNTQTTDSLESQLHRLFELELEIRELVATIESGQVKEPEDSSGCSES